MSTYTIIDLHATFGPGFDSSWGTFSRAHAINNHALIVGETWVPPYDLSKGHYAVLWDRTKQRMIHLGVLGDTTTTKRPSQALSVNEPGGVVGSTVRPLGDQPRGPAFYWEYDRAAGSASIIMVDLPVPSLSPGSDCYASFGRGISDAGVIVGHLEIQYSPPRPQTNEAVWWQQHGRGISDPQFLPTFGLPGSKAAAINMNGTIVGRAGIDPAGVNFHACRWNHPYSSAVPLLPAEHKLLSVSKRYEQSYAWAISRASDIIVGASGDSIQDLKDSHPCVWRHGAESGGSPAELLYKTNSDTLGIAYGVNNSGRIVGLRGSSPTDIEAFFFDPSKGLEPVDLFSLISNGDKGPTPSQVGLNGILAPEAPQEGWTRLAGAQDINDAGEIVGAGVYSKYDRNLKKIVDSRHAFLMIPG